MATATAAPASPEETPKPPPPPAAPPPDIADQLTKQVERIRSRLKIVNELFKDDPHSPVETREFKKFIVDRYSEMAMRFVLMGAVSETDQPDIESRARKAGFAVGSAPLPGEAPPPEASARTAKAEEPPQETSTKDLDTSHPLMQHAIELGFNPNEEDE